MKEAPFQRIFKKINTLCRNHWVRSQHVVSNPYNEFMLCWKAIINSDLRSRECRVSVWQRESLTGKATYARSIRDTTWSITYHPQSGYQCSVWNLERPNRKRGALSCCLIASIETKGLYYQFLWYFQVVCTGYGDFHLPFRWTGAVHPTWVDFLSHPHRCLLSGLWFPSVLSENHRNVLPKKFSTKLCQTAQWIVVRTVREVILRNIACWL